MDNPKELFKYRNFDKYTILNLISNSVWIPSPASLNDPFDAQLQLSDLGEKKEALRAEIDNFLCSNPHVSMNVGMLFSDENNVSECYKKKVRQFIEFETLFSKNMGILSLSETPENSVMWSHYSESHAGICIGYFTDKLIKTNIFQGAYLGRVDYLDEEKISRNPYLLIARLGFDADSRFMINGVFKLYSQKSKDWCYEKEWRYLIQDCNQQNITMDNNTISSITFGLRTPISTKEAIVNILKKYNEVKFYQIERKLYESGINRVLIQNGSKHFE